MRIRTIGLTLGFILAAAGASQASTPAANGDDLVNVATTSQTLSTATEPASDIVIARRGRGADDPPGDDHGRHRGGKGKGKGGKGHGGHDDGPNHT